MKIYIASSFDLAAQCETARQALEQHGHTIPDIWWNVKTKDAFQDQHDSQFYGSPLVQSIAVRHWRTIRECDLVILVSSQSAPRSFTGANIEIGFAIGLGIPVVAVGQLKRSAMYSPVIQTRHISEMLDVVNCIGQNKR